MNKIKSSFGERLKYLRIKNNRTQKEIAEYLNITLRAYQYYESGNRFPPVETIILLSEIYAVSFLEVLLDVSSSEQLTIEFNEGDNELSTALSNRARNFGISKSDLITYILMSSDLEI